MKLTWNLFRILQITAAIKARNKNTNKDDWTEEMHRLHRASVDIMNTYAQRWPRLIKVLRWYYK